MQGKAMIFATTATTIICAWIWWLWWRRSRRSPFTEPIDIELTEDEAREVVGEICPNATATFTTEYDNGYDVGAAFPDGRVVQSEKEITWSAAILNFIDRLNDEARGRRWAERLPID